MLQSAKAAAVGGAIARREHVPTLTQVPPMAPDSITAPWYGNGRMVGDVVYKYMMMRVSWNGMSLLLKKERARVWQWVPRWHLQTAGLRKILLDKAASPRALPTQITERKGKEGTRRTKFRDSVLHVVYMLL